ncbi:MULTISPECIES: replication-relaxation family protein [unclassified Bradyrhizobium]|uniref:replication-relaxation family protein n=1 Tax=unclassified Bradyrhizobium TaxID=2631580 RepID=UPI002916E9B3|nr:MULTISPECIES: replication-relaxation family protein [unclassified Bradyrhizobium]
MDQRSRNSRWDREPKLDRAGRPIIARLSEDDLAIFKLLGRYRYLPSDYLAALTGRSIPALQARLEVLCRKPNGYVNRPHQQRANANANTRRLIYELDDRGADELRSRGLTYSRKKYLRNFAHELMACTIAASFEIGAKSSNTIRLIGWHDLLDSPQMPSATKRLANPQLLPIERDGRAESLASDWRPFVVERNAGSKSYAFVFGFEADCGTEPIDSGDDQRTSIRNKFIAYLNALNQGVPARHFGASTFLIPFVTTTKTRMLSMIDLLERLKPGAYGRRFLFKHIPSLTSFEKPAPASGHMLFEPWQRAGFEPFSLAE